MINLPKEIDYEDNLAERNPPVANLPVKCAKHSGTLAAGETERHGATTGIPCVEPGPRDGRPPRCDLLRVGPSSRTIVARVARTGSGFAWVGRYVSTCGHVFGRSTIGTPRRWSTSRCGRGCRSSRPSSGCWVLTFSGTVPGLAGGPAPGGGGLLGREGGAGVGRRCGRDRRRLRGGKAPSQEGLGRDLHAGRRPLPPGRRHRYRPD